MIETKHMTHSNLQPRSNLFSSEVTCISDQIIIKNRLGLKSCKSLKQVSKVCATRQFMTHGPCFPYFYMQLAKHQYFSHASII